MLGLITTLEDRQNPHNFTIDELIDCPPKVVDHAMNYFFLQTESILAEKKTAPVVKWDVPKQIKTDSVKRSKRKVNTQVNAPTPEGFNGPGSKSRIEEMREFYEVAEQLLKDKTDNTPLEGLEEELSYFD